MARSNKVIDLLSSVDALVDIQRRCEDAIAACDVVEVARDGRHEMQRWTVLGYVCQKGPDGEHTTTLRLRSPFWPNNLGVTAEQLQQVQFAFEADAVTYSNDMFHILWDRSAKKEADATP